MMSTRQAIICAACAQASQQEVQVTVWESDPDLDGGPPTFFPQRCPMCGFTAMDISNDTLVAAFRRLPEIRADSFECYAMTLEESGAAADDLTRAWIEAAWSHDQADTDAGARRCRERVLALSFDDSFNHVDDTERITLVANAARRVGRFDDARRLIDASLAVGSPPILRVQIGDDRARAFAIKAARIQLGTSANADIRWEKEAMGSFAMWIYEDAGRFYVDGLVSLVPNGTGSWDQKPKELPLFEDVRIGPISLCITRGHRTEAAYAQLRRVDALTRNKDDRRDAGEPPD